MALGGSRGRVVFLAARGVVGLVNMGHETTNINILDDGVPVLTRDIPIGTRRFKEDLQRERGLSAEGAAQLPGRGPEGHGPGPQANQAVHA